MKAVVVTEFGSPDVMKVIEVEIPTISDNEVLIGAKKTSVNFADIKARYGKKGNGEFPFMVGLDVAGVVEAVGANVQHLKVGQRVVAFPSKGSYAEYVVANEKLTYVIPETLSWDVAAASPIVSFLSYMLLEEVGHIKKGETVLVHAAAGGVGTTAIQLAKLLGAGNVIGTVGSERKIGYAKEAGADYVMTYEDFPQMVNEVTNGKGVDVILDSVSGDVFENSLQCLAPYGRLVHFGNSGGKVGTVKTNELHSSCRSVLGFSLGTTRKQRPELLQQIAPKVFSYLEDGSLSVKIGHHFALSEAAEAHKLMESRLSTGKILLDVRN